MGSNVRCCWGNVGIVGCTAEGGGGAKPPATEVSCRAPHSGQNMLSVGICSPHDPQFIFGPLCRVGATLPKALPMNGSSILLFRGGQAPLTHIFIPFC